MHVQVTSVRHMGKFLRLEIIWSRLPIDRTWIQFVLSIIFILFLVLLYDQKSSIMLDNEKEQREEVACMFAANSDKEARYDVLKTEYERYIKHPLNLDITRGIPSKEQLDLSAPMLSILNDPEDLISEGQVDIRNYGGLTGISEIKRFFSAVLGVDEEEILAGGNSSLSLMYAVLVMNMYSSEKKWTDLATIKFLCPSPGYDRHFSITEKLGIEMIPVEMDENGPDMDTIEHLVKADPAIKGIWCVPTYSNPTGIIYSDNVVDRLAQMETSADDFIILWDNAYLVHHLTEEKIGAKNVLEACKKAGHPDRAWMFCSTSKVTFPGAGVAALAASKKNIDRFSKELSYQTIGHDKLNQMRHVKFLQDPDRLEAHMAEHAAILKPKFDLVKQILHQRFEGRNIVEWTEPKGGYFIHLKTKDHCASAIVAALDKIGVKVTKAGATYPYGENPADNSIRLAPTSVSLDRLEVAMDVISLCIEMCTLQESLEKNKIV